MGESLIAMVLAIPAAIWNAFVLKMLWGWFVAPIFHLPTLTIPVAIGISLIVGILTYQIDYSKEYQEVPPIGKLIIDLAFGLMFLGIGFVASRFI
jgi:hypothetical protein